MSVNTDTLLQAGGVGLGIGVLVWFAVTPLVASIPYRLEKGWEQELAELAHAQADGKNLQLQPLSRRHQAILCAAATVMGMLVVHMRGFSNTTAVLLAYLLGSLLLAAINWRTTMLPDRIVLPLLWAGLLFNAWSGRGAAPIYGATVGFCVPWLINWVLKRKSGGDAIGYGDMKTFGMAGAWFGLAAMPTVFVTFFACLIAQQLAIKLFGLRLSRHLPPGQYLPTGVGHLASSLAWIVGVQLA